MNLASTLQYTAERTPHAEAVIEDDEVTTYSQLVKSISAIASGLAGRRVSEGDVVATALKNRLENIEIFWACQWLGAVFVPLSWRNPPATIRYSVEDARAKVFFYEEASEDHAAEIDDSVLKLGVGDAASNHTLDDLREESPIDGHFDLPDQSTAIMLYTSGTTGKPKGVPRSHRAERASSIAQALQHGYVRGERTLGVMPLYHTMGTHSLMSMAVLGGCYVAQPEWDPSAAIDLVSRHSIGSLYLAPTLFYDLVSSGADSVRVRALGYAGAAMTGALVEQCNGFFRPDVFVNHYGSTEIYCYTIGGKQSRKPGNAGPPSMNARIRLVDLSAELDPNAVVGAGMEGQIICHLSSDEAFTGYWNSPDADAKAIRDGWYFTGDLGRFDDEADLWIVGRVDDMIISGGENIYPLEVEDVLARAPGVEEVAVFAVPDDRLGQQVVAAVVAAPGVTAADLDRHCLTEDLARYKRPRQYRFVTDLPKSPSGKILRRRLRNEEPA